MKKNKKRNKKIDIADIPYRLFQGMILLDGKYLIPWIKSLGGGGEPAEYIKSISGLGLRLSWVKKDGTIGTWTIDLSNYITKTTAETITGTKTFTQGVNVKHSDNAYAIYDYGGITFVKDGTGRVLYFPNKSGTIATTSDITTAVYNIQADLDATSGNITFRSTSFYNAIKQFFNTNHYFPTIKLQLDVYVNNKKVKSYKNTKNGVLYQSGEFEVIGANLTNNVINILFSQNEIVNNKNELKQIAYSDNNTAQSAIYVAFQTEGFASNKYLTKDTIEQRFAEKSELPSKTSQLQNDSGFITAQDIPTIPTKTSQLQNDSNFTNKNYVDNQVATKSPKLYLHHLTINIGNQPYTEEWRNSTFKFMLIDSESTSFSEISKFTQKWKKGLVGTLTKSGGSETITFNPLKKSGLSVLYFTKADGTEISFSSLELAGSITSDLVVDLAS